MGTRLSREVGKLFEFQCFVMFPKTKVVPRENV